MTKLTSLHLKARKIINKYDPIHLIGMGCPVDEYDGEVRRILDALDKVNSPKELSDLIHKIFVKMFFKEIAGPKENYQKLASELYKLK